jgi:hypothetical protein
MGFHAGRIKAFEVLSGHCFGYSSHALMLDGAYWMVRTVKSLIPLVQWLQELSTM